MASVDLRGLRIAERADGPTAVLAIGTANPPYAVEQRSYPDFYFRVTNSDHMHDLKLKFKRICDKSTIDKHHFHLTEAILKANANICDFVVPSLDARQAVLEEAVPKLGAEAAARAIEEWGRPHSAITHLVFCSTGALHMPGPDYRLMKLLRLPTSVKRVILRHQGCHAGGTVLRVAKDLAENNKGAHVLAVSSESFAFGFRGPNRAHLGNLVGT